MDVERQVEETIEKYNLMKKSDKVVVALSGGKDSTSVLYILKKLGYDVHGLMIDLYLGPWSETHKENMKKFCEANDIPLTIVDLKKEIGQGICFVKAVLKKQKNLTGCTVCGIIKKWILNRWARKLGADVIVTGHNLDDEAQNVLMNFLKGNVLLGVGMGPATGCRGVGVSGCRKELADEGKLNFVQRVKPLFFIPENDIRDYAREMKFDILYDKCPCSFETYRADTRDWTDSLSDDEKLDVVKGFMDSVKGMKIEEGEMKKCERCGEVARGKVCKFCEIVRDI